tara:strand:- start:2330 stop:3712 length:1383 start_codon:yes stop_codon:yes gene_type:complete
MKYNINNYKKKIIKIVSQKIKVNYKEPYKLNDINSVIGSGFFIKDNYIITCSHCIDNARDIYIEVSDEGEQRYKVELVGLCPYLDIAVLKSTEYKSKEYFKLGNSDKITVGNNVVAIGFPLGQTSIKITSGIISGRQDGNIQTDTPVNPGNSGGPLIYNNKVVGIVSSGIKNSSNVGFAIPINKYDVIKTELYDKKQTIIYRTGINTLFSYNNSDDNLLSLHNAKNGIYISDIGSKIHGLKHGDILCSINNNKIDNFGYIKSKKINDKISINELIDYIKIGDSIKIEYVRNKKSHKTSFIYKNTNFAIRYLYPRFEKLEYEVLDGIVITGLTMNYLKLMVDDEEESTLNMSLYKYFEIKNRLTPKIIVSYIYPNTDINNLNVLKQGDIITKCNNIEVETIEDLRKASIKFTIIKKKRFILLETDLHKTVIIDVNRYINKGNNNRNTFRYPITPLYKILAK